MSNTREAAVAAALREAAEEIEAMRGPTDVPRTDKAVVFDEAADRCVEIVLALITPDAQAALDRVVAAERERCARVAENDVDWSRFGKRDLEPWETGMDGIRDYRLGIVAARAIAAAIRKGGGGP